VIAFTARALRAVIDGSTPRSFHCSPCAHWLKAVDAAIGRSCGPMRCARNERVRLEAYYESDQE